MFAPPTQNDVFVGLQPLWNGNPEVKIYVLHKFCMIKLRCILHRSFISYFNLLCVFLYENSILFGVIDLCSDDVIFKFTLSPESVIVP